MCLAINIFALFGFAAVTVVLIVVIGFVLLMLTSGGNEKRSIAFNNAHHAYSAAGQLIFDIRTQKMQDAENAHRYLGRALQTLPDCDGSERLLELYRGVTYAMRADTVDVQRVIRCTTQVRVELQRQYHGVERSVSE